VIDPAAKTSISWQVGMITDKIAHVAHQRDIPSKTLTPDEIAANRKAAESRRPPRSEFKGENLGTRIIAGVDAIGSRTIRTIPAGEEGNKLPLVTTNETWMSKEFGFVVLAITDDPRRGRSTFRKALLLTKGWVNRGTRAAGNLPAAGRIGGPNSAFLRVIAFAKTMPVIPDVVQRKGSNAPEAVALATSRQGGDLR
jgi:hypothetical protein